MEFVLLGLILVAIPFVLPVLVWVRTRRLGKRLTVVENVVVQQAEEIDRLTARLEALEHGGAARPEIEGRGFPARPEAQERGESAPPAGAETVAAVPVSEPVPAPADEVPAIAARIEVSPAAVETPPSVVSAPAADATDVPIEDAGIAPASPAEPVPEVDAAAADASVAPPPVPPRQPALPKAPFDWESLIGVKLFAAIAGVALVVAAVLFLRYSIDQGWLQPPVRVTIGVLVAIALLVLCELKSAREYPATANALDGAAIAILFATFYSAHALWNLIPATATFALLAVVTALAVLLSIRRESLFIAVLGLVGGFATPALLSTGENRPIPLFAYLLLLNIGLAWVAYRNVWPILTWLTLGLTTLYQVIWVARFLDASSLSLAMGIFLVFPLAASVALAFGDTRSDEVRRGAGRSFERTAMLSAGVPLLFAAYLSATPAYGAHAGLLLGFLWLVDAGLLAIAIARRLPLVHAAGGVATLVVLAVWVSTSYEPGSGWLALAGAAAFVALYLAAPLVSRWFARPFAGATVRIALTAPLVLFVFPVLTAIEPAFERPLPMFAALLVLVVANAWRAAMESAGAIYYVAAFFAIAAQAVWAATYLTDARLSTAVAIFTAFGLVSMAAPVLARRAGRALQPAWGSGAVLLASLVLLVFVSLGPVTSAALWALALLLAIMNAGLFIESASGGLPRVAQAGSLLSYALLGLWWMNAAGSVGVLPSLIVMTGLTLITVGGHAWAVRRQPPPETGTPARTRFRDGLYLALVGHVFLYVIAGNRTWSLPPWPIFGALAVMTLAISAASLAVRTPSLHAAGAVGAAAVVLSWAAVAGDRAWGLTAVLAAAAASGYALAWTRVAGDRLAVRAAAAVLFVGELAVLAAADGGARPPFAVEVLIHAVDVAVILALTARERWRFVAIGAVVPAWMAVLQWQQMPSPPWLSLLTLAAVLYAVFLAYPFALGDRARSDRDPYLAAVLASGMFFFAGRRAFEAGGLAWAVGAVPVVVAAALAVLLRRLLQLEPAGQRDIGRLALVAGAALAFVTVAIPLQLDHQWITIGWALEGAAMAWLYRRIPHRGLFYGATALLATVFARLVLNPEILLYEPRGSLRIFNWYLYAYAICAAAMFVAAWWLSGSEDRLVRGLPRVSALLPAAAVILLFYLLNIEIADYYSTGPTIAFRFGAGVSQDLTYTIGWLAFGMLLLAAGIYARNRPARVAAVALIAVTTLKCFLYDLSSLEGLYRVGSFVGLAFSLALVSLALKKYVLSRPKDA